MMHCSHTDFEKSLPNHGFEMLFNELRLLFMKPRGCLAPGKSEIGNLAASTLSDKERPRSNVCAGLAGAVCGDRLGVMPQRVRLRLYVHFVPP